MQAVMWKTNASATLEVLENVANIPQPGIHREPGRATAAGLLSRLDVLGGLAATFLVVVLHFAQYRHAAALWRDEVNSVNLGALSTLSEIWGYVFTDYYDSFPAPWPTLMHGWITAGLGSTDAGLRGLGLVIGLTTVVAFWWAGRRLGFGVPWVCLLLFGLSGTAIVYGDSLRAYGLAAALTLACLVLIWDFVQRPTALRLAAAQVGAILATQITYSNCAVVLGIFIGAGLVCLRR
jgi:hypothetical protein